MLYRIGRIFFRIWYRIVFRYTVIGKENVPLDGPLVLASNHISMWDPPTVGTPLDRKVHFMAKAELFDIPGIGTLFRALGAFPVKRGGISKESIRLAQQHLRSGNAMGIFPEGSRKNAGGMGKKGAASLAIKSGAAVVPVAIIGNYRWFRPMTIVYGKPVDLSPYAEATSEQLDEATEAIMSAIREQIRHYKTLRNN